MEPAEQNELVAGLHDAVLLDVLPERTQAPSDLVLLDPRSPFAHGRPGGCCAHACGTSKGHAIVAPLPRVRPRRTARRRVPDLRESSRAREAASAGALRL